MTNKLKISPSVLACDFSRLGWEVAAMEEAGADMIHLDIMDGHFVPNISFGPSVLGKLRPKTKLLFDTHLMISEPLRYIGVFAKAGADIITFHVESDCDPIKTIDAIERQGKRPGMALKPDTPAEAVFPYLGRLAMVLVMTVEPGFGGQTFMPDMCEKISLLCQKAERQGLALDIQVDGGIDPNTAPLAVHQGANVLVAGSSLFGAKDYAAAIAKLRNAN